MSNLTFGEQVKIVLSRKGMTIKELAEIIEEHTGKKMSRQNLTQRLGRDNFQEQDMRMIASILGCPFQLSILGDEEPEEISDIPSVAEQIEGKRPEEPKQQEEAEEPEKIKKIEEGLQEAQETEEEAPERGITVGEFLEIQEEMDETSSDKLLKEVLAEMDAIERESREWEQEPHSAADGAEKPKKGGWLSHFIHRREELPKSDEKAESGAGQEYADDAESADRAESTGRIESADKTDALDTHPGSAAQDFGAKNGSRRENGKGNLAYFSEQRGLVDTADGYGRREKSAAEETALEEEDTNLGEVNPYTGREYASNSVRMHPKRIGYVQVYSRKEHKWTDMTEWAFLGYQERKKVLLGKDYEPPIYLD